MLRKQTDSRIDRVQETTPESDALSDVCFADQTNFKNDADSYVKVLIKKHTR